MHVNHPASPIQYADPLTKDRINWQVCADAPLLLHCWDGDYVVYNPLSGNTHILDVVSGEVLQSVVAGHGSRSELCRRTAAFLQVPDDARVAEHVQEILDALDELALIEPADRC
jgi:PqqD family protein of HPr-rel-A system